MVEDPKVVEEQAKLDKEQLANAKGVGVVKAEIEIPDEPMDKIDKANEVAERLERANKKHEELVLRQEKLAVNNALGGESELPEKQSDEEKGIDAAQALVPKELLDLSKKKD